MVKFLVICGVFSWMLSFCQVCIYGENVPKKPNIVVILADDVGSHDISLRGNNQILTPNIDALGYQGVIMNRHYTVNLCSPSRAALLSGKYSIRTGMQYLVVLPDEAWGLPLTEKLLPQYLKEVGYQTYMVGKWHLGSCLKAYIPTHRGFDTHVGLLGGAIDYYNYSFATGGMPYTPGFDFRYNEEVYRDRVGEYATDVLGDEAAKIISNHNKSEGPLFLYLAQVATHAANDYDPMQFVPEDLEKVGHIKDQQRRVYAAMIEALDRSVGTVVKALKAKDLLDNTIILYFSDNGGPTNGLFSLKASNYPLRGQKQSPWEGAHRGVALVWSPLLQQRHRVSEHLTHITDWLPTFAQIAGSTSIKSAELDGFDIWETLSFNKPPIRREMVHIIDPISGYTSYYRDGWKYINGTTYDGQHDGWLGEMPFDEHPEAYRYPQVVMESEVWGALNPYAQRSLDAVDIMGIRRNTKITCKHQIPSATPCYPLRAPCLFNVESDPCEFNNLADLRKGQMQEFEQRLEYLQKISVPPGKKPSDPRGYPDVNDGLWTWWLEGLEESH
ncbi:arylsulfatase B-like [Phlebotomus argentipes]|uniref:arylsulfatase B-like n=1 Tax=Phlebotomus argentipes TaxID=94469 RepID=UPI002893391B|nr:arylsulfatase B-like [Phlebotomus argentipes]